MSTVTKRAKSCAFGTPKMVEAQLDHMLEQAGDDPQLVYMAWEVADTLYEFYSNQHADMYHDDPISQGAPSECFDLHMSPWKDLYWRIQQDKYPARCRYEEYMVSLHETPTQELEDLPF